MKSFSIYPHSLLARTDVTPASGLACHLGMAYSFDFFPSDIGKEPLTPLEVFESISEQYNDHMTFDEALSKSSAEFMALGTCYYNADGKQPISAMIRVGDLV
jgi:hypothetical protein